MRARVTAVLLATLLVASGIGAATCRTLAERGADVVVADLDSEAAAAYLQPIRARWEAGTVPSDWKKAQVRDRLAAGDDLETAITGLQREYARLSRETESFAEWI